MTTSRPDSSRRNIVFAFALAFALYICWLVRVELLLIYVSALFAVVLIPVVDSIARLRIGRWSPGRGLAVLLLLLTAVLCIAVFCMFALPPVIRDLNEFAREIPVRGPQLLERIKEIPFLQHVQVDQLNSRLQDWASNFATYLLLSIKNWAHVAFEVVTGIVLTIYFLLEGEHAYAWFLSFFPLARRNRLDKTLNRAEIRMGKWLLGQAALMAIQGTCSTIVFLLLRVRYAYALGVLMGLFNIIPIVGAMISVTLAVLVAAIDSWGRVLGVLIFYALYAQVEASFLTPRIMKSRVDLAGLAVLVALLLGSSLAGISGAMVAVPTAVLVAVLLDEYFVQQPRVVIDESSEQAASSS